MNCKLFQNPGFFYYSGFTNLKEDELREKKVTKAKRTVSVLQTVKPGVELMRTGSMKHCVTVASYNDNTLSGTESCPSAYLEVAKVFSVSDDCL